MFIELEPIFNNIGASVPFDYEMDMSDEEFWAGKPFQKAVRVKGEAVNRAGIVCIEAQATVEVFTDCDRCASSIDRVFDVPVSHTLVTSLNDEENDELILVEDMHFELDPLVREDIFLTLPENNGFQARHSSVSGHFTSDFSGSGQGGGFLYKGGGPLLSFTTTSGDVRIARG